MDMKAVRKQLGLTQVELGAIVYLTPRQLSKIESGRTPVPKLVEEKLNAMLLANPSDSKHSHIVTTIKKSRTKPLSRGKSTKYEKYIPCFTATEGL